MVRKPRTASYRRCFATLFGKHLRSRAQKSSAVSRANRTPICERIITLVASHLPTFCALPLAKCSGFA